MKQPDRKALRQAAHALRWAGYGYRDHEDKQRIDQVRVWLTELAGAEKRPHLLAEHLFLYAVNTGQFYETHCRMAKINLHPVQWRRWVRQQVVYGYNAENAQKVWVMPLELYRCTKQLIEHYRQHLAEAPPPESGPDRYGKRNTAKGYRGRFKGWSR